jgi:hypothetical protein
MIVLKNRKNKSFHKKSLKFSSLFCRAHRTHTTHPRAHVLYFRTLFDAQRILDFYKSDCRVKAVETLKHSTTDNFYTYNTNNNNIRYDRDV